MEIKNFTQFVNLLQSTQTLHLHGSFNQLSMCMTAYNGICNCGGSSNSDKIKKYSECNRIYRESLGAVDGIKAHLFQTINDNTISFFIDDSHLVKTICR